MIVAFGLVACGGGNKPAETDAAEPETKETTEEETKVNEPKEEEAEEAEPEEPQPKIPENATEFLLTNPKIQAQANFYLPNEAKEWEIQCLNKKDPVNVPQRYVYKSENAVGDVLMMDIRQDLFLYSKVDRVKKPEKDSSESSTHTSSSGTTHGGGGGKF